MTEREYTSLTRKYAKLIKQYEGIDLHIAQFGAIGEIDGCKIVIEESALLPEYMNKIIDQTRVVISHIKERKYVIDYINVYMKNDKLYVRAKLLKDWIEVFDYAKNL